PARPASSTATPTTGSPPRRRRGPPSARSGSGPTASSPRRARTARTATGSGGEGTGQASVVSTGSTDDVGGSTDGSVRSRKRWSLPVAVFGSSVTNSIARGYLYG